MPPDADATATAEETAAAEAAAAEKVAADKVASEKAAADAKATAAAAAAEKAAAAASGAPDSYSAFEMPDGYTIADERLKSFHEMAKGAKLTQAQAQGFVKMATEYGGEVHNQLAGSLEAMQKAAYAAESEAWGKELDADKELSGPDGKDLAKNLGIGEAALEKLGGKELMDVLKARNLGNNPAVVRFFVKIGALIQQDSLGAGPGGAGGSAADRDAGRADRMYPNEAASA